MYASPCVLLVAGYGWRWHACSPALHPRLHTCLTVFCCATRAFCASSLSCAPDACNPSVALWFYVARHACMHGLTDRVAHLMTLPCLAVVYGVGIGRCCLAWLLPCIVHTWQLQLHAGDIRCAAASGVHAPVAAMCLFIRCMQWCARTAVYMRVGRRLSLPTNIHLICLSCALYLSVAGELVG